MNTVVNIAPRGLYFHGKVIGMLVVFLGYKILILVFFKGLLESFVQKWNSGIFGSARFPYRVKMRSFQKVFSKICIF